MEATPKYKRTNASVPFGERSYSTELDDSSAPILLSMSIKSKTFFSITISKAIQDSSLKEETNSFAERSTFCNTTSVGSFEFNLISIYQLQRLLSIRAIFSIFAAFSWSSKPTCLR